VLLSPNYILVEEDSRGRLEFEHTVETDGLGMQPSVRPEALLEETKRQKGR
jgi:hypothetical protein